MVGGSTGGEARSGGSGSFGAQAGDHHEGRRPERQPRTYEGTAARPDLLKVTNTPGKVRIRDVPRRRSAAGRADGHSGPTTRDSDPPPEWRRPEPSGDPEGSRPEKSDSIDQKPLDYTQA